MRRSTWALRPFCSCKPVGRVLRNGAAARLFQKLMAQELPGNLKVELSRLISIAFVFDRRRWTKLSRGGRTSSLQKTTTSWMVCWLHLAARRRYRETWTQRYPQRQWDLIGVASALTGSVASCDFRAPGLGGTASHPVSFRSAPSDSVSAPERNSLDIRDLNDTPESLTNVPNDEFRQRCRQRSYEKD